MRLAKKPNIHKAFAEIGIFIILIVAFVSLVHSVPARAAISGIENPIGEDEFDKILRVIVNDIIGKIGIPVLIVAWVYVGFMFIVAQGNEKKLEEAKHMLTYAVVGTAIIMGAVIIKQIVCSFGNELAGRTIC